MNAGVPGSPLAEKLKPGLDDYCGGKMSRHPLAAGLYEHLNPMPFEAATQMEIDLSEDLRRAGYTVTGGH